MKAWIAPGILLLAPLAVHAQFTSESLKQKYLQADDGSFVVEPGVTLKAIYGDRQQACVLAIFGAISADKLKQVFDQVVPAKTRGRKKLELIQCVGGCMQLIDFQKLHFSSGLVGTQTAEPDAIVSFKRRDCKPGSSAVETIPMVLTRSALPPKN
jgi:hypothetical protein